MSKVAGLRDPNASSTLRNNLSEVERRVSVLPHALEAEPFAAYNNPDAQGFQRSNAGLDDQLFRDLGIEVRDFMFYVTTACPMKCRDCYVGKWLNTKAFGRTQAERILRHFGSKGLDRITILGGEPLLYPHITDLITSMRNYPIREKRITTSAVDLKFLDFERIRAADLDHISISIDGVQPSTHEANRGTGTFDHTMRNMRVLRDQGFEIRVTYTVTALNKHEACAAVRFSRDMGASEINFHLVTMIGNAKEHPELHVSPGEWVAIRRELESISGVKGIRMRIPLMYVTPEEYAVLVSRGLYQPFQNRSYHSHTGQRDILYPNGYVYMSCDLTGSEFNFAVLRDGRFVPGAQLNELAIMHANPANPDPSATLLSIDTEGFVRLSISYKETIQL